MHSPPCCMLMALLKRFPFDMINRLTGLSCAHSKCKQLLEKLKQEQQSALRTNTYQTSVRAFSTCCVAHGRRGMLSW